MPGAICATSSACPFPSRRTFFPLAHLATTASLPSIPIFAVKLAGARPTKQIVQVLARAGWQTEQTSVKLRVPDHVHLLFLPPYSPKLQPAEHLWPLTDTCPINQHFATIEELEDAQFAYCADLQQQRKRIRSTTLFHWFHWCPQRIKKRQGPR